MFSVTFNHSKKPRHFMLAIHRHLLMQLVVRDVAGRYKGSIGGLAWTVIQPVLMLAVYLFVFGLVFNPRRGASAPAGDLTAFGLSLFCGMLVHGLFSECLIRAPGVIVSQPAYVKKIVFPLQLLPLVVLGSALFHFAVGLAVLLTGALIFGHPPGWTILWLLGGPAGALRAGVAWLFASLGVFLRDIGQLTGLAATVMMFLSPVFYPLEALPAQYRWMAYANPLTVPIEAVRDVLLRDGRLRRTGAACW
jgi:lipopolysaccharide transport system permease protein